MIGISSVLLWHHFLGPSIHLEYPKYRAIFANGEKHIFTVYPENNDSINFREFLKAAYNPSSDLIHKHLDELIKSENILSQAIEIEYISSKHENIVHSYHNFISLNILLKIAVIYFILLLIRFIVWAIKMLKAQNNEI